MKIVQSTEPFEIEIKRFYIPGTFLSDNCPKCQKEVTVDLGDGYLSYIHANKVTPFSFYCDECDTDWNAHILLRITLEVAKSELLDGIGVSPLVFRDGGRVALHQREGSLGQGRKGPLHHFTRMA